MSDILSEDCPDSCLAVFMNVHADNAYAQSSTPKLPGAACEVAMPETAPNALNVTKT
ncbi:hypothetical protein [Phyllobacterium sp. SB3]|uniref:hypothetical protein n=1 Tax=Phyllobacterium sp. SB3 TaxID=3156073 RepID=UPI0032AFD010